jgi:S-(hydroxymethyl)mycothiol dehydrogenase
VVKVQPCGVCHTGLHYVQGGIGDGYPYLPGHEAVGDGVRDLAPGDYVILSWRAVCGTCRACKRGRPWYCFATFNATQEMTLEDGSELALALGIGAYIEQALAAVGQRPKVDAAAAPRGRRPTGLWVMTGAAINDQPPDGELADGGRITVAGTVLEVIPTPGHAPASVWCSPATPCSTASRAPPDAHSPTTT